MNRSLPSLSYSIIIHSKARERMPHSAITQRSNHSPPRYQGFVNRPPSITTPICEADDGSSSAMVFSPPKSEGLLMVRSGQVVIFLSQKDPTPLSDHHFTAQLHFVSRFSFVSSQWQGTSMMDEEPAGCCRCCCSFILSGGLTALFLWLGLRTSGPVCSVQDFYVPALNKSANSTSNHTIYLHLELENKNNDKGIRYDALNLSFRYVNSRNGGFPVANYTLPGFYQGHKKKAHRRNLSESYGVPWEAAIANGSAIFRVDLASAVRFKIMFWYTKRHKLAVGANVEVDSTGQKAKKKGIRLNSGAPETLCCRTRVIGLLIGFGFPLLAAVR